MTVPPSLPPVRPMRPAMRRPAVRPARRGRVRRLALLALLVGVCGQAVGCHNLQEHRRARWNYGPGMSSGSDPYAGVWHADAVEDVA